MPHATTMCDTLAEFVALHKAQLESSGIPKRFWDTLFIKLKNEMFDAGEVFGMMQVQEAESDFVDGDDGVAETEMDMNGEVVDGAGSDDDEEAGDEVQYTWQVVISSEEGVDPADPGHVYLIDHAWTYRVDDVRKQLAEVPGLLTRMAALMEVPDQNRPLPDVIDDVFSEMWKYNQTYKIANADLGSEAGQPIWYVMDEFGSRIQHSDSPSVKMVPFYYVPSQMTFTIMWPLKVMCMGDEVTRDYIDGSNLDHLMRRVKMLPWQPDDMTHLSYAQHEMDESFFMKFKVHETLPNLNMKFPGLPRDRNIRVFTDIDLVCELLSDNRFELVDDPDEADIWWTRKYLSDFRGFSEDTPDKFISQFPFEMVFTVKDLLAMVSRRASRTSSWTNSASLELSTPKWLQITYNLQTELPQFVSYFQQQEQRGMDNHWIAKPWNLSRSLDMHVTNNLNYILRLPDTGPKIVCKYIEDPVLFELAEVGMVKFDMRFVVMLCSINPLKIMAHNKFLVRLANKEFSLDNCDDYEKHFTVMQYKGKAANELKCEDFVTQFEEQYPETLWATVQTSTYNVITEVFEAASSKPPPKGVGESPQSRAIYGVDLMLKWETDDKGHRYMQPVLFEVNFIPDIRRLANFYPDFFNECFAALFLDDFESGNIDIL